MRPASWYWHCPRKSLDACMGLNITQRGVLDVLVVYCAERRSWAIPERAHKVLGVNRAQWESLRKTLAFRRMLSEDGSELRIDFAAFGAVHRSPLSAATRQRIIERDGEVCAYCRTEDGPWEIDHKHPVAKGGSDDDDNLTVACQSCNRAKRDLLPEEWGRRVRQP